MLQYCPSAQAEATHLAPCHAEQREEVGQHVQSAHRGSGLLMLTVPAPTLKCALGVAHRSSATALAIVRPVPSWETGYTEMYVSQYQVCPLPDVSFLGLYFMMKLNHARLPISSF